MQFYKSILFVALLMTYGSLSAQSFLHKFISVGEMCTVGNTIYFNADDGYSGAELWKTDGTPAGTKMVKDINLGFPGSGPANLTAYNNELYFSANDGVYGSELWKSDGTTEGTILLKNIKPEIELYNYGSLPSSFRLFKNELYFTAADEWDLDDIWKTNGTENGTVKVYETEFVTIAELTVVNDALFFRTFYGTNQLFVTDGTAVGTHTIPVDDYYNIEEMIKINNKLYFITSTSYRQQFRLYALNPDDDSFIRLREYNSVLYGSNDIDNMTEVNGELYYSIRNDFDTDVYTDVLWKSDGTISGTDTIRTFTFNPYWSGQHNTDFINFNNKLYFRGKFAGAYTLYESNGTYQGTLPVTNLNLSSEGIKSTISNGELYFTGFDYGKKIVLKSDGTAAGTSPYNIINEGVQEAPTKLFDGNGILYYTANDATGFGLWNNSPEPEIKVKSASATIESGQEITITATAATPIPTRLVIVSNTGLDDLFISGTQLSGGDFYLDGIDRLIPPGESRNIKLTFFPVTTGNQTAELKIYSNDATEGCFVIRLKGVANASNSNPGILNDNMVLNKGTGTISDLDTMFLSNSLLPENEPVNTAIGMLNIRDASSEAFTYSLVSGTGDRDNGLFHIANNIVYSSNVFDYETRNTYSIRVKAAGSSGSIKSFLLIRVTDLNEPLIAECGKQFIDLSFAINDVDFATDTIVFGVGGNGVILKSTDWGNNWTRINSGTVTNLRHIQFVSSQVGYILGDHYNDLLLKTENGGDNWAPVDIPNPAYPYTNNLFFINAQKGFVVGDEGKVFKTSDGGRNWEFKNVGYENLMDVYFINEQDGFICGRGNKLFNTSDGGATWVNIDMSAFGYSMSYTDICFTNPQTGYLLGDGTKILKTTDGGQTWSLLYTSWVTGLNSLYFLDENTGFLVGGSGWANMFKTTDAGLTWDMIDSPSSGDISSITMNKSGTRGCVSGNGSNYGSSDNGAQTLFVTSDGGNTWQTKSDQDADNLFQVTKFFNDSVGYIFTDYASGVKTTDGGLTWLQLNNIISGYLIECHFISADTMFVVTTENVRRSNDGGITWTVLPNFPGFSYYCFIDCNHIFYTNNGKIYETEDGGQTWNLSYSNYHFLYQIYNYDENLIIALGMDVINTSRDGGNTWSSFAVDNGPTIFEAIYFQDANTILVGGQKGRLLRSTDGGLTWTRIYTTMYRDIKDFTFSDNLNGIALTSSDNSGSSELYATKDGGFTWMPFYSFSAEAQHFCVMDNGDIYISGSSGYIVRYTQRQGPSGSGFIYGENQVCRGTETEYMATPLENAGYTWEVIPSQQINFTGNKATISWTEPGTYQVKATPVNNCGIGLSRILEVMVQDMESASIMGDDSVQQHEDNITYLSNAGPNVIVNWQARGETGLALLNEHEILVDWETPPAGEVNLIHTSTETGCRQMASMTVYIFAPENTKEALDKLNIEVYPNPTTGKLYIKPLVQQKQLSLELSNANGVQVHAYQWQGNCIHTVDMESLNSGIYFLRISDGVTRTTFKIVKP